MKYTLFGDDIYADQTATIKEKGLPSGIYTVSHEPRNGLIQIENTKFTHDKLVDIHDNTYQNILKDIINFYSPATKQKYIDHGFVYKKCILLHGIPGTGKTCLVSRMSQIFEENFKNGVVLFTDSLGAIPKISKAIPAETPVLIIAEEVDSILEDTSESLVLNLLDGEGQRANTFYLFTTNFIKKIPKRLFRPSRISNIIEIKPINDEGRRSFIQDKIKDIQGTELQNLVDVTKGFTFDEMKHLILSTRCLNMSVNDALKAIEDARKHASDADYELEKKAKNQNVIEQLRSALEW